MNIPVILYFTFHSTLLPAVIGVMSKTIFKCTTVRVAGPEKLGLGEADSLCVTTNSAPYIDFFITRLKRVSTWL